MSKLTGIKDVDIKIVNMLNDYELSRVCQVNKYVNEEICNDQNFWMNRVLDKFGSVLGSADLIRKLYLFQTKGNWKEYYKFLLNIFNEDVMGVFRRSKYAKYPDMQQLAERIEHNNWLLVDLNRKGNIRDIDNFLNNTFLVNYYPMTMTNNPEVLKYYLERSKSDFRFFKPFKNNGKELLDTYSYFKDEYPELLEVLLKDPRIKT